MDNQENIEFKCAFCDELDISLIMDFGLVALAGGFLKPKDFENEKISHAASL